MRRAALVLAVIAMSACPSGQPVADFGDNPGGLALYEHVPSSDAGEMPLVLLLHGCSQGADDMLGPTGWRALADEHGFALALAEQSAWNNGNRCFNWFEPGDHTRDQGEASSLASAVRHMLDSHDLDDERVFVTGLSAGAAMTSVMLATYPELFAAGAALAGGPYGCAENAAEALSCMTSSRDLTPAAWGDLVRAASLHEGPWPRLAIWHGDADLTVNVANAAALEAQWMDLHGLGTDDVSEERREGASVRVFGAGEAPLIERWTLPDLGHAVPIDPDAGCGSLAPFFSDADLCSTAEVARFFGLLAP